MTLLYLALLVASLAALGRYTTSDVLQSGVRLPVSVSL